MASIVHDNIVYPVIDLIDRELSKMGLNPLEGVPSVQLYRDHPLDSEKLTSVDMFYESGWRIHIVMGYGSEDGSTYPDYVYDDHPDFEYFRLWRLNSVTITTYDDATEKIIAYHISLNYDLRGLLTSTVVSRI